MTLKLSELEALTVAEGVTLHANQLFDAQARDALPELLSFCRRAKKLLTDYTFPCSPEYLGEYLKVLDGEAKKLLETIED